MGTTLTEQSRINSTYKAIKVLYSISEMLERGEVISYASVAKRAQVSRTMLYAHPDLCNLIETCRITSMTKAELQQEVIRLRLRVRNLEQKIQHNGL